MVNNTIIVRLNEYYIKYILYFLDCLDFSSFVSLVTFHLITLSVMKMMRISYDFVKHDDPVHGWLTVSLLSAESSRLGLHFVENFHRQSRVIAFGSLNAYRGNLFRGVSWVSKGVSENRGDSFSHSFLDEFYWNFMNERRAVFQIRHDRKEIGNRNRIIAGAITPWIVRFSGNRLFLYMMVIVVTAWDNWRKCRQSHTVRGD